VIETASGKLLPDSIERTRAASLAWKRDDSGFFYTRYPKKGDVPEGQEVYNRHVFYHALGADPAQDPLIFGEGRDPEWWPNVHLSEDGRWLLIVEEHGWTKTEMFLQDLTAKNPPVEITAAKISCTAPTSSRANSTSPPTKTHLAIVSLSPTQPIPSAKTGKN
jgi:prolyl oligopeptidase